MYTKLHINHIPTIKLMFEASSGHHHWQFIISGFFPGDIVIPETIFILVIIKLLFKLETFQYHFITGKIGKGSSSGTSGSSLGGLFHWAI